MNARPTVTPPSPWAFPDAERHALDNGMALVIHQLPGQHLASISVVVELPLSAEPADREGVATITARCLDEGTAALPGSAFATALEACGAVLDVHLTLSGMQVDVDVPVSRLDQAVPLLRDAVTAPLLDEADVSRHVGLRLAEIDQQQANSAITAALEYRRGLFESKSRAQRPNGGDSATVEQVKASDVQSWHRLVTPARTTVVVAGDLPPDVVNLLRDAFGAWSNEGALLNEPAPRFGSPSARLVHRPGAVQADIRLGGLGIDRHHPQWAELLVAVHAVGGAFGSRVNLVLREEKGWTYGSRVALTAMRSGGFWATSGSFRTDVVVPAITEAKQLLDISNRPITQDEVTDAINWFTGISPLQYATADAVASQTASNLLQGLTPRWTTQNLTHITKVTPETATAAYRTLIDLDRLWLVVVGDAEQLTDPLRAAGWDV